MSDNLRLRITQVCAQLWHNHIDIILQTPANLVGGPESRVMHAERVGFVGWIAAKEKTQVAKGLPNIMSKV